jgi:hypothetical protein
MRPTRHGGEHLATVAGPTRSARRRPGRGRAARRFGHSGARRAFDSVTAAYAGRVLDYVNDEPSIECQASGVLLLAVLDR